jgi:site-specific DNA-methyltransferase (adenine-specific)
MSRSFSEKHLKKEMQSDPRDWVVGPDGTFVLVFRKPGRRGKTSAEIKDASKIRAKEWNEFFCGHWSFSKRDTGSALKDFDTEIAKRCIRMFSFAGDTILDPFSRDGTTIFAAHDCRRSSIAYTSRGAEARKVREAAANPERRIANKHSFQVIEKNDSREPFPHLENLINTDKTPKLVRKKSSSRAEKEKK